MKLWVGVTDRDWFDYLTLQRPDEVNFWQPSGSRTFRVLQPASHFCSNCTARELHRGWWLLRALLGSSSLLGLGRICAEERRGELRNPAEADTQVSPLR